ncbi:Anaphase-promoting complex subunit 1 [Ascosphaera acerosa]|nr:Anaphase-promoting complex subunit 1 [Ascosphaera acerosa]
MASVRSLGLHQPVALQWLIDQHRLEPTATEGRDYRWRSFGAETGAVAEEELIFTRSCVVWSRGGCVMRSWSFDVEKEDIVDALMATFERPAVRRQPDAASMTAVVGSATDGHSTTSASLMEALKQPDQGPLMNSPAHQAYEDSRALVVVLKTQAHVFYLHGGSHIVSLPFEVESVWAAPKGVLLQRKAVEARPTPSAQQELTHPQPGTREYRPATRSWVMSTPGAGAAATSVEETPGLIAQWPLRHQAEVMLPRLYTLTDLGLDIGIVATTATNAKAAAQKTFAVLDVKEELIYISREDESPWKSSSNKPLYFVITYNNYTRQFTAWTARYNERESAIDNGSVGGGADRGSISGGNGTSNSSDTKHSQSFRASHSKRRSSHFDLATGASTPVARQQNLRESIFSQSRISNSDDLLRGGASSMRHHGGTGDDDLATQLSQEFGDFGLPSRASRRVSSLMARTDLAASQDRTSFSEYAGASQSAFTPINGRHGGGIGGGRRGESLGGRSSLGFGKRRSSVFPGSASVYSNGSSYFATPVDRFLESVIDTSEDRDSDASELLLEMPTSGLAKELLLCKVASFPCGVSSATDDGGDENDHRQASSLGRHARWEVFSILNSQRQAHCVKRAMPMTFCIMDKVKGGLVLLSLLVEEKKVKKNSKKRTHRSASRGQASATSVTDGPHDRETIVQMTEASHAANVLDCCKINDGSVSRLLIMTRTIDGRGDLTLQAPWGNLFKIDIPTPLTIVNPLTIDGATIPPEQCLQVIETSTPLSLVSLQHPSKRGHLDIVDDQRRKHRLQIQLEPRNALVRDVIETCQFALQDDDKAGDGIMVAWWEVQRWLRLLEADSETRDDNLEWTAMVIVLFSMAVYFVEQVEPRTPSRHRRRKAGLVEIDQSATLYNYNKVLEAQSGSKGLFKSWMSSTSWGWMSEETATAQHSRTESTPSSTSRPSIHSDEFITHCATLAREYLVTPGGEIATGIEGYLPTAIAKDPAQRQNALASILVALHLLREEKKLSLLTSEGPYSEHGLLGPVLAQIGGWLDWPAWTWKAEGYYGMEMGSMGRWAFEDLRITGLDTPAQPYRPPSILECIQTAYGHGEVRFKSLMDSVDDGDGRIVRPAVYRWAHKLTPRTYMILGFLNELRMKSLVTEKVELLLRWGLSSDIIDTLPDGISVPLHEAVLRAQARPVSRWDMRLLTLVGRQDLLISQTKDFTGPPVLDTLAVYSHDAAHDVRTIGQLATDHNTTDAFEVSAEADRKAVRRLLFPLDRRYEEAEKMLNQSRPTIAEQAGRAGMTDARYLEMQMALAQLVALRTLSVPAGRGMLLFGSRVPLLTEKLPMPSFSLQCVVKPSNVTLSADRISFAEERATWAFFHNGVAAGLSISRSVKGIDTSWILFNRPPELTNRHAGFLFALGLNGHLRTLAKWVAFKYLTAKHTTTSVGLLLGLSVSFLGTMDAFITRLLCVHVTRMLPAGSAELNLSPLMQTAGVVGIGLLYCGCQHRRMSEVMLSEIESLESEDTALSQELLLDEGYQLAAGFALGFINLGKGKELIGLRDMHIVDRLLAVAVGTKEVDVVHIRDKATAGAIVAVTLMFMKSNDPTIASRIDIPDTPAQYDYVRPDFFLLRTLAKHLVMWNEIAASFTWIKHNVPARLRKQYRLRKVKNLHSDDMVLYYIIAGLCFALGLRYAGSSCIEARDILLHYLDEFKRIGSTLPEHNYDQALARQAVRNCQDITALSAAAVMAGTGDVPVLRRLRSLHGRVTGDQTFGTHMASHMALGLLFLGGGTFTLGTSDLAIASLICAFYPIFPKTFQDNKCHLQALRHLWVLAAEPRCLIPRDAETRRAMSVPITMHLKSGEVKQAVAPCLLPELNQLQSVLLKSPEHWELCLDIIGDKSIREKLHAGNQSVYLQRRSANAAVDMTVFRRTLFALSAEQDILNTTQEADDVQLRNELANPLILRHGKQPLQARFPTRHWREWVFALAPFRDLDAADKALVLPRTFASTSTPGTASLESAAGRTWLQPSAVDVRLMLHKAVRSVESLESNQGCGGDVVRDALYQLRLLFAWLDHSGGAASSSADRSDAALGLIVPKDLLEEFRWRLWSFQMGGQLMSPAK